ncbi:hypothetical protein ACUOCP_03415, partial [Escherichia sp. R-CC3]
MSLNADYQKLEPGDEVRLFEVDGTAFGTGEVLRFHSYSLAQTEAEIAAAGGDENKLPAKSIWWQGEEYKAWPCQIEGIEAACFHPRRQRQFPLLSARGCSCET